MSDSTTVDINADLDRAWATLVDVTDWPRWTSSMTSVERLDDGPLDLGSRARVKQPGIPSMVWQVTELRDREVFTWAAGVPGARTSGVHRLSSNPDGSTRLTLELRSHGPVAWLIGALTAARNRRYMALEATGMKAATESTASTR